MNRRQIIRELLLEEEADTYIANCEKHGPPFVTHNDWTEVTNWLYVKHLRTSKTYKSWQDIAEKCLTTNVWEEKAKECRARRTLYLQICMKVVFVVE